LVLITEEGLVLAGIATEVPGQLFDDMHFWKVFHAAITEVKVTKRTEEAKAGEERLWQASTTETETNQTVAMLFEGVVASRQCDPSGKEKVMADNTNVGKTDDKSLYNEEEEVVPWVDEDTMAEEEELLVAVKDEEGKDNDNNADDDDDNMEVPETHLDMTIGSTMGTQTGLGLTMLINRP
jgi:hypothetical protein